MDYAAMAAAMTQAIPFNAHVGLETTEIAPGVGVVELPDDGRLRNHVGSQHAAALFAAGEAASGGAFVSAFAARMSEITPLAERADIAYRRIARGRVRATGRLSESAEALLAALDRDGMVRFPIAVELTDDGGDLVAEMTVHWHVRKAG